MPDEEIPVIEGPDPRAWHGDPAIWERLLDVEAVDRVYKAMEGEIAQDEGTGPAYQEGRRLLRHLGGHCREQLALALLAAYGVEPGETETSPFDNAGRSRAFGAGTSPPDGTLPAPVAAAPPEGTEALCLRRLSGKPGSRATLRGAAASSRSARRSSTGTAASCTRSAPAPTRPAGVRPRARTAT